MTNRLFSTPDSRSLATHLNTECTVGLEAGVEHDALGSVAKCVSDQF